MLDAYADAGLLELLETSVAPIGTPLAADGGDGTEPWRVSFSL